MHAFKVLLLFVKFIWYHRPVYSFMYHDLVAFLDVERFNRSEACLRLDLILFSMNSGVISSLYVSVEMSIKSLWMWLKFEVNDSFDADPTHEILIHTVSLANAFMRFLTMSSFVLKELIKSLLFCKWNTKETHHQQRRHKINYLVRCICIEHSVHSNMTFQLTSSFPNVVPSSLNALLIAFSWSTPLHGKSLMICSSA